VVNTAQGWAGDLAIGQDPIAGRTTSPVAVVAADGHHVRRAGRRRRNHAQIPAPRVLLGRDVEDLDDGRLGDRGLSPNAWLMQRQ
jgi:hypothetical protein